MAMLERSRPWPRFANAALGAWLALSAFVWIHPPEHYTNALLVGVLAVPVALIATWRERVRYVNAALAVWLFASIWTLPGVTQAIAWNHALVALAMFAMAMLPNHRAQRHPVRERSARPVAVHPMSHPADSIV